MKLHTVKTKQQLTPKRKSYLNWSSTQISQCNPQEIRVVVDVDYWGFLSAVWIMLLCSPHWWTFSKKHNQKENSPQAGFFLKGTSAGTPASQENSCAPQQLTRPAWSISRLKDILHIYGVTSFSIEIHNLDFQLPRGTSATVLASVTLITAFSFFTFREQSESKSEARKYIVRRQ